MKTTPKQLDFQPQYIIDKEGKKTAVILDLETFKKIQEELEDFYFATMAEAALEHESEFLSHEEVKKKFLKSLMNFC